MKKNVLILLLALIGASALFTACETEASAYKHLYGDSMDKLTFGLNEDGTEYWVSAAYEEMDGEVRIPTHYPTHDGKPVTRIADYGFQNVKFGYFGSVEIPYTVTVIGEGAFKGSGMKSVTIDSLVVEIQDEAFDDCKYLTSVVIRRNNSIINKGRTSPFPGNLFSTYLAEGANFYVRDNTASTTWHKYEMNTTPAASVASSALAEPLYVPPPPMQFPSTGSSTSGATVGQATPQPPHNQAYYQSLYNEKKRKMEDWQKTLARYKDPRDPLYTTNAGTIASAQRVINEYASEMRQIQAEAKRYGFNIY